MARGSGGRAEATEMRIGIVDDHPIFRLGLRQALDREPGIRVVWDAASADQGRRLIGELPVDVILMDVRLGDDVGGLEATYALARERPEVKVVMISALADDHVVRAARRAGAVGYFAKDLRPEQLARALRALGSAPGPARSAGATDLFDHLHAGKVRPVGVRSPGSRQRDLLTQRELQVLAEIRKGRTSRQIASTLGISPATVNKHVHKILQKLNVRNRAHAAARRPSQIGLQGPAETMVNIDH